jgi:spore coat protein A, manganese oxidase
MKLTRREALIAAAVTGTGAAIAGPRIIAAAGASVGQLNPNAIPQFSTQLFILPAMPTAASTKTYDRFSLAARPFRQQILPRGFPTTPVFGFGSTTNAKTFHAPGYTIEATVGRHTRLTWSNQLMNSSGNFVPHILPVDPTIHWANPPGGTANRDKPPKFTSTPGRYTGPVPLVVHLHGAHAYEDSDGYPEAWYLPLAKNIPAGYATVGSRYYEFKAEAQARAGVQWGSGMAQFEFANDQPATGLWYHDHSLGMTRLSVRAGLLGMYMLRGGARDVPAGHLPGPAPRRGDRAGTRYYEIPLVIQDPSFNTDGTQYLPAKNLSWSGPYIPETDIPPIWNGLYYGSTITVNGNTWPNLNVEPRRYRFRVLNGCAVRQLALKVTSAAHPAASAKAALPIWVIGSDGGFLPHPVELSGTGGLPILPAERYDIIVDFTGHKPGTHLYLTNEGAAATQGTTGTVMRFTVVPLKSKDKSIAPKHLTLPKPPVLETRTHTRQVSLSEVGSSFQVSVISSYQCGTVDGADLPNPLGWDDAMTEEPKDGSTEVWEVWNFSPEGSAAISHVFHLHQVQFEVLNRQSISGGPVLAPHPWELGRKDSCASPTGYITRVKAHFDHKGLFVWHCHLFDHEDNSMMRPFQVV